MPSRQDIAIGRRVSLTNRLTQEAKARKSVVARANKKGKSYASQKHGVSLSSVKRRRKRHDGTWRSLLERSLRPKSHPNQHTAAEEAAIRETFKRGNAPPQQAFLAYGSLGLP
jgi:hypothetical protein